MSTDEWDSKMWSEDKMKQMWSPNDWNKWNVDLRRPKEWIDQIDSAQKQWSGSKIKKCDWGNTDWNSASSQD